MDGEVSCGITLARRKKYDTVGSSGPRALAMDEIQYGFGDGPCLSAIREARTELAPDVTAEPRWPEYMATVFQHGVVKLRDIGAAVIASVAQDPSVTTHFDA